MLIRPLTLFGATIIATLTLGGCPMSFPQITVDALRTPPSTGVRTVPADLRLADVEVTAPFTMIGGLPFVEVFINDAGPLLFLLDTGAATTVVTPSVTNRFPDNVAQSDVRIFDSTADMIQANSVLRIDTLSLGGLELLDFDAITLDLDGLSETFGVEVSGILGFPAFTNLLLTVDYNTNTVIASDTLLDPDAAGVVPMTLTDGHPFVSVQIGDTTVTTMLDTGHAGSYSLPSDTPGIAFESGPQPWFSSVDLSGPSSRQIARLAGDVTLGPVLWETPIVTVDGPLTPNLGSGFMSFFAVSFDQRSGLVEIATGDEPSTLQSASVTTYGLQLDNDGDRPVVAEVLAGSPADLAGIQVGDELITVDGLDAGQVAPAVLFLPTEQITLQIVRDDDVLIADISRTVWVP